MFQSFKPPVNQSINWLITHHNKKSLSQSIPEKGNLEMR